MVFALFILANAIVLGVEIEISLQSGGESGPVLFWIQVCFYLVFVVELVLRICADGAGFFSIYNLSGLFDFFIVTSTTAEYAMLLLWSNSSAFSAISVMRVFRLLRIGRIVRILHICPELYLLTSSLASSVQTVFWVFCLLIIVMYICALACTAQLGQEASLRDYFGSIDRSCFTHFMILTLEGYPAVAKAAGETSSIWYVYIVAFILFSSVVLINLVTGIVVECVCDKSREIELDCHELLVDAKRFHRVFGDCCIGAGVPTDEDIGLDQFRRLYRSQAVRAVLYALDISLDVEDFELFEIIDEDNVGSVTFDELIDALLRLQGSKDFVHSIFVQGALVRESKRLEDRLGVVEESLGKYSTTLREALKRRASGTLANLREKARPADGCGSEAAGSSPKDPPVHLRELLLQLEHRGTQAANTLAKIGYELHACRSRTRPLETQLRRRHAESQTEPPRRCEPETWNNDRDMVAKPLTILLPTVHPALMQSEGSVTPTFMGQGVLPSFQA